MDFYSSNVVVFVAINLALSYRQWRYQDGKVNKTSGGSQPGEPEAILAAEAVNKQFKRRFLPVYLLVSGADWLQGPYIYTMYKDEKGLAEETVGHLFLTGFLAAAISGSFVGSLADRYGRRSACLFFCVTYSVSCMTILFDDIIILFLGRVLGGFSTILMYSVFESWMVTEYHRQHLDEAGGSLNDIFGTMSTLNSIVAIIAGLFAQGISDLIGTQKAPFMISVACLILAFLSISKHWSENYGESANRDCLTSEPKAPEKSGFQLIKDDKRLWALAATSCFFEGSMYLWIFFKFPALRFTHQLGGKGSDLPFGMIFAALMTRRRVAFHTTQVCISGERHRDNMFMVCGGALLTAAAAVVSSQSPQTQPNMAIPQNIVFGITFLVSAILLLGTYHRDNILSSLGSSRGDARYIFVDLGANRGDSLEVFLGSEDAKFKYDFPRPEWATYKQADIYLFEANPVFNTPLVLSKEKYAAQGINVNIFPSTVVDVRDGTRTFFLDTVNTAHDFWGSSIYADHPDAVASHSNGTELSAINISRWLLMNTLPRDFVVVKMDIEGAEYEVIPHMAEMSAWTVMDHLLVEWHALPESVPGSHEMAKVAAEKLQIEGVNMPAYDSPA
ncbi:Molybdate transporter [Hyphodiscus hymeniophilus]|uniref:Molybdate-anion transporter n=1 Tax=Hyphodiscus hymeniophilus TaxID=353542 RepID=A0A9P7AZR8_9HELO|nr:Molybdate transporter [Hyphodiscus hymeniophilus]